MSAVTQCPKCGTRFRASQTQLEAHHGTVRCGQCQETFDAMQNLFDEEASPQLSLPINLTDSGLTSLETKLDDYEIAAASSRTASPLTLTGKFSAQKAAEVSARKSPGWVWGMGALLLTTLLLAQAAYFFRIELAARLPGLKPALTSYCLLLKCSIPLPNKADLMSIESSDLEADTANTHVIILNAILRNRAPYPQAYPSLELTLTDITDKALARRIFRPVEYLESGVDEKQGILPSREISIKLTLDTTDLQPTGYQLLLFYL